MEREPQARPPREEGLTRRQLFRRGGIALGTLAAGAAARKAPAEAAREPAAPAAAPTPGAATAVLRVQRTTMNPDGRREVSGLTYNGSFPGPEIRVREGDLVRLQLENLLDDSDTLTHWHGILVPAAMDGVPVVSAAPLPPRQVFVYEYPIRQSGTYWYHSHYGLQEQLGLAGAYIIEARDEPGAYDHDAVLLLSDWTYQDPAGIVPALRAAAAKEPDPGMTSMAAKGGGAMKPDLSDVKYDAFLLNGTAPRAPWTLAAKPGQRIRLRLINGGASTYFNLQVDGHPLRVTHADGEPVRPVEVDRILLGMGETYDATIEVAGSGSFTIHAMAQDGSGQALGVIHTPDVKPQADTRMPPLAARVLSYGQLEALRDTTLPAGVERDFRLVLGGEMKRYVWTLNGETWPDAKPLGIRQGERVRVELVNETMMFHPMHLHGHFFRLLAGQGPRAPLKHTVNVPPAGSARIEFTADNPGSWIFHCHNLYHLEAGMGRVFRYEV